ncbi:hypothetical protein K505DRAFT_261759 [Melanomma pulvis-pyrius CBS 109.77]|uniref:Protein kinase domain-containing protein n=1 Tax=Melanomma pulvis-pyrius CBS 109.77 TaxID=1314802 RepID=A0A6A6WNE6_9PLEO|nr:hypothetical protein K505DRAFT_261759 [Melanomma pulvis-pyrius CBS 109.77]
MAPPLANYEVLYQEAKPILEAAEQRILEEAEAECKSAKAQCEAAQAECKAAEQRRHEAVEKVRPTTLPEFLNACHNHFHSGLPIETDATDTTPSTPSTPSTPGNAAHANNKLRPDRLVWWADFPTQQAAIWEDLMESGFASEQHFTSVHGLEKMIETVEKGYMSSCALLLSVEQHVSVIVQHLHSNQQLRRKFGLQGLVKVQNHSNTLSPESQLEQAMEHMTLSGPRLQGKETAEADDAAHKSTAGSSRPQANQFCAYNSGNNRSAQIRIPAFILEYQEPHELPLGCIYQGLGEMELEEVLRAHEDEPLRDRSRRLVAAAITQTFSYMVRAGLEYGTVHYFLSVPKGDVGEMTGWTSDIEGPNRLHLTARGQMLAFTLQALKTRPRSQQWRIDAVALLSNWEVVYQELLDAIPERDTVSSEYQPPVDKTFLQMSPVQLRGRRVQTSSPSCRQRETQHDASDEEPGPDPDTPSRQSEGAGGGQYCTQECLRGLVEGGLLDSSCPNVTEHGETCHQIDRPTFLTLMGQQLAHDRDTDCDPASKPGSCGVLVRVRLRPHGYTVVAKCTPAYFLHRLQHEESTYKRLLPIQGTYVPVCLGSIELTTPYMYEGITELTHMLFLSFGGDPISRHITMENKEILSNHVEQSACAIHNLQVLHGDLAPRNILWDEEAKRAMVMDFERAYIMQGPVPGVVAANQKQEQPHYGSYDEELNRVIFWLSGIACSELGVIWP